MSNEKTIADRWLYATMTNDATLTALIGGRVYAELAPETATFPHVVFTHQGNRDVLTHNAVRVWTDMSYAIKAVDRNPSQAGIEAIADRLSALFERTTAPVADGTVVACFRDGLVSYTESRDGEVYRHLGVSVQMKVQHG